MEADPPYIRERAQWDNGLQQMWIRILYRTSARTSKRKIYYYRCLGSDNFRYENGAICNSKPIRQDYLDELVWSQVVDLLENPELIRSEIQRRIKVIRDTKPC